MATKKIQKLIQSKVGVQRNIPISFSKQKQNIITKEKPFLFENLESDKDDNDIDDFSAKKSVNKTSYIDNEDSKSEFKTEAIKSFEYNLGEAASTCGTDALRTRVGSFGKSMNLAFKDAHSAINSILHESVTKKVGRKSTLVSKSKRVRCLGHEEKEASTVKKETDDDGDFVKIRVNEDTTYGEHPTTESDPVFHDETVLKSCEIHDNNATDGAVSYQYNTSNDEVVQQVDLVNLKMLTAVGSLIFIFILFSISNFIMGLICGVLMSFGSFKLYESFFSSVPDVQLNSQIYPKLRDETSPVNLSLEEATLVDQYAKSKASFSAWVDAVNNYHHSRHNSDTTYSLHMSLEGTKLFLRKLKDNVPHIATEYETEPLEFEEEKTVELLHAKVYLLPRGLVRRRMWSKRYPICIAANKNEVDSSQNSDVDSFFFFARTCRDKEEIFRRLMAASLGMPINLTIAQIMTQYINKDVLMDQPVPLAHVHDSKEGETTGKIKDDCTFVKQRGVPKVAANTKEPQIVTYVRYMAKFMSSDTLSLADKSNQIDTELTWFNALLGRVAWDVFRGGHWIKVIREKIQTKLVQIHLPYFVDPLEIMDIDLGLALPVIRKVGRPYLNKKGLWVEFEVVYDGGFSMGLETKMNLMKLKDVANRNKSTVTKCKKSEFSVRYQSDTGSAQAGHSDVHDDDIELDGAGAALTEDYEARKDPSLYSDDSMGSTSESELSGDKSKDLSSSSSNKSFLKWVDKFAKSSYFLKATDNKFVQRTMAYVSNTSLQLQVDAQYLNGTLIINIPPPPSNRLWWGFKASPQLTIKARPKVGQKEIQMTKLVEFIEKKLLQEFHRAVVLPNMDDISIPLLFSADSSHFGQTSS